MRIFPTVMNWSDENNSCMRVTWELTGYYRARIAKTRQNLNRLVQLKVDESRWEFAVKREFKQGLTKQVNNSKGPITWSIFNPGVELSPVYRVEISALSVIQNSIKIKRAIRWQNFQPRVEIIMSYSSISGSDYLLQENKIKAFFTSGNRCRERIV
jgi:hypothetical protein